MLNTVTEIDWIDLYGICNIVICYWLISVLWKCSCWARKMWYWQRYRVFHC